MCRVVHEIVTAKDVVSASIANEPHAAVAWVGVLLVLLVSKRNIGQSV